MNNDGRTRKRVDAPVTAAGARAHPTSEAAAAFIREANALAARLRGQIIWLGVPYSRKDEAKALGARWDGVARRWHVNSASPNADRLSRMFPV